jgi:hypothetical protein
MVFDCPDRAALASFYAELLGGQLNSNDPNWWEVHLDDSSFKLAFQLVASYVAPDWPNGSPQQLHLDLTVSDLFVTSQRAVSLDAVVLGEPVEELGCVYLVHVARRTSVLPLCGAVKATRRVPV